MNQHCIFCKILKGDIPGDILYRDDHCFVINDIAPRAPVHLLVIPKQHLIDLPDTTPLHTLVLASMFVAAAEMAKRKSLSENGFRLVINQGQHSGQQVPHLHMHLLGGEPLGEMC